MGERNLFTYSMLLSRGYEPENVTVEDIKNVLNEEVNVCHMGLYIDVIQMLAEGKSYDEIFEFIDSYTSFEFENLLEDQKTYIKSKTRRDLMKRKKSLEKETI